MKIVFALFCGVMLLAGCAQGPAAMGGARGMEAWVRQQGGVGEGPALERVKAIGAGMPLLGLGVTPRFHVLNTQALVAYSWPSGDVYLSARLVAAATDDEIAAAMAHEAGHWLQDARRPAALRGEEDGSLAVEMGADAEAVKLLARWGRPREGLETLLKKVSAACDSAEMRASLAARVDTVARMSP